MKNRKGEAITVESYRQFILKVLEANNGIVLETDLDNAIVEAYSKLWGPTDKAPWGAQKHPKWKQNVASAKSALDRKGFVVRYDVPTGKITLRYRVLAPPQFVSDAMFAWSIRKRNKPKRAYDPLDQPRAVFVVPD